MIEGEQKITGRRGGTVEENRKKGIQNKGIFKEI